MSDKKKFQRKGKSGPRHPELHDSKPQKVRKLRFHAPPHPPKPPFSPMARGNA